MNSLTRKVLGLVIAPVGAFSIIGTGFSLWEFGESGGSTSFDTYSGVKVTPEVNVGEITINQCPDLLVFSTGTLGNDSLFDGITFYSETKFQHNGQEYIQTTNDSTLNFTYTFADNNLSDPEKTGYVLNLGVCLELTSNGKTGADNLSYQMSDYLSIVDIFTNSSFNVERNDHNYFVLNSTNNSYDYANTSLSFRIENGKNANEFNTINVSFALNQFLRYKNSSVKPTNLSSYETINDAAKLGEWKFSVHLTAFFTEYAGGISI